MDASRLGRGELIAMIGGLLLLVSIFVKSYETRCETGNAHIGNLGCAKSQLPDTVAPEVLQEYSYTGDGTFSMWQVHNILRILFILGAIAPFFLAYIILRDHKLSWPRGEMTSVVAITCLGLLFYIGIVDRPGEPSGEIELEIGWYGAMLGSLLMLGGSVMRSSESERRRKPPGVL